MSGSHCGLGGLRIVKSELSKRDIGVNDTGQVRIASDMDPAMVRTTIAAYRLQHIQALNAKSRPDAVFMRHLSQVEDADTVRTMVDALDVLIGTTVELNAMSNKSRLLELLIRFHSQGMLAIPMASALTRNMAIPKAEWAWGENYDILRGLESAVRALHSTKAGWVKAVWVQKLFLACQGAKDLGDLVPEVDGGLLYAATGGETVNKVPAIAKFMIEGMRLKYGSLTDAVKPEAYGTNKKQLKTDGTFVWVLAEDPSVSEWVERLAQWLQIARTSYALNIVAGNNFLKFLVANRSVTRQPFEFLDKGYRASISFEEWLETTPAMGTNSKRDSINRMSQFLGWILKTFCSIDNVVSPKFRNPIAELNYVGIGRSETHRPAMPVHFVRMLKDIIRAPYILTGHVEPRYIKQMEGLGYRQSETSSWIGDVLPDTLKSSLEESGVKIDYGFAWPRTQQDYFNFFDRTSGTWGRVWSPVRAIALLMKLETPLRTFQVRMLDSGEADAWVFRKEGGWIENGRRVVATDNRDRKTSKGVLRRLRDQRTGEYFTGLYINTNKTGDLHKEDENKGYESPLHNG